MHTFHSVPIVFGLGVGKPGNVEYQIDLYNGLWMTLCTFGALREAVEHARYDEVNFRKCLTRILVHLPYPD